MKPKSLFKRVFDFARAELERRARPSDVPYRGEHAEFEPVRPVEVERGERPPEERPAPGLSVLHADDGGLRLAWSVRDEELRRARSLLDGDGVLCVRVVAYSPLRDDVLREVQDRPGVEPVGSCDVGVVEGRAIVSIGLRAGERYVSITHHVI